MKFKKNKGNIFLHLITAPVIYSVFFPAIILDVWVEIYHRICFPVYGIKYIKRKNYIKIDRQKLKYLTLKEKFNCMYCGYVNGLFHYVSVIAGETEKYWCGIKHKKDGNFVEPSHHKEFLDYGDEQAYYNF